MALVPSIQCDSQLKIWIKIQTPVLVHKGLRVVGGMLIVIVPIRMVFTYVESTPRMRMELTGIPSEDIITL